jgi:hypothetical protein
MPALVLVSTFLRPTDLIRSALGAQIRVALAHCQKAGTLLRVALRLASAAWKKGHGSTSVDAKHKTVVEPNLDRTTKLEKILIVPYDPMLFCTTPNFWLYDRKIFNRVNRPLSTTSFLYT